MIAKAVINLSHFCLYIDMSIHEFDYEANLCRISIGSCLFRDQCELRIGSQSIAFSLMKDQPTGEVSEPDCICPKEDLSTVLYAYNADSEDSDDEAPTNNIDAMKYCMVIRVHQPKGTIIPILYRQGLIYRMRSLTRLNQSQEIFHLDFVRLSFFLLHLYPVLY